MSQIALFISRFQMPIPQDLTLLQTASEMYDGVLVLVSGAGRPCSVNAPLPNAYVQRTLQGVTSDNVTVLPLLDTLYDDQTWVSHVRICLNHFCDIHGFETPEVTLMGQTRDNMRAMTGLFPDWSQGLVREDTAATRLAAFWNDPQKQMPKTYQDKLAGLIASKKALETEHARVQRAEEALGYQIVFNTADALVTQSNHLLAFKREDGLLALPGVHLQKDERSIDAALRAACKKANLDMPKGALSGRLKDRHTFDHPKRSERGRVRTEVFHFDLPASGRMENVKGDNALWLPFHECTPDKFFEDHYDICQALLRGVWCDQNALLRELN